MRKKLLLVGMAGLLGACAQQSAVKLYPGQELAASQLLTLEVPPALEILQINGQELPAANRMLGTDVRQLQLQPGEYRVSAFYEDVFYVDGGMSHEVVRSNAAQYQIAGKAGDTWRLDYNAPDNLQQARELQESFTGWAQNTASGERVEGQYAGAAPARMQLMTSASRERLPPAATTVVPLAMAAESEASTAERPQLSGQDSALTTLQQLWLMLDSGSRAEFLDWAER